MILTRCDQNHRMEGKHTNGIFPRRGERETQIYSMPIHACQSSPTHQASHCSIQGNSRLSTPSTALCHTLGRATSTTEEGTMGGESTTAGATAFHPNPPHLIIDGSPADGHGAWEPPPSCTHRCMRRIRSRVFAPHTIIAQAHAVCFMPRNLLNPGQRFPLPARIIAESREVFQVLEKK
jgi:hypothetical protein